MKLTTLPRATAFAAAPGAPAWAGLPTCDPKGERGWLQRPLAENLYCDCVYLAKRRLCRGTPWWDPVTEANCKACKPIGSFYEN